MQCTLGKEAASFILEKGLRQNKTMRIGNKGGMKGKGIG
jgi:hypothetical protein